MIKNPYLDKSFKILSKVDYLNLNRDVIECDVVVVGSGAGGGVAAFELVKQGYKVCLIEEGSLRTSEHFNMMEGEAYSKLYQDCGSRQTKDKGISILQGKTVGGGTTVNWTTSFRLPKSVFNHWTNHFSFPDDLHTNLQPVFSEIESEFNISPWETPPNENNQVLLDGLKKQNYEFGVISRNVKDCHNLGFCGMGCPTNAKQSTLVNSIPKALRQGMQLLTELKAWRLEKNSHSITSLICHVLSSDQEKILKEIKIKAKKYILSAGSIGTPAIVLRSHLDDPHSLVGKRTFVHPVIISAARMSHEVLPFYGAPQVIYSDHFLKDPHHLSTYCGFKIEVPPVHPVILSSKIPHFGPNHYELMKDLPHLHAMISLFKDGFHEHSQGGVVSLGQRSFPVLDYQISDYMWESFRKSLLVMAELQLNAGAEYVYPLHFDSKKIKTVQEAKSLINSLSMKVMKQVVVSAHVMGGMPFGTSEKTSILDLDGKHRFYDNLFTMDGSIFPTSLGVNPMESILSFSLYNSRKIGQTT